jgi:SNF2 family DNA or RNA helicase
MLKRENLHHYQNSALDVVLNKKKCALFLDMGLGKTTTTLTAIHDLYYNFSVERILIIAPLKVANNVWHKEAQKWEHLQELDIAIATGSVNERLSAINSNKTITLINKENVPWLIEKCKWKWDMVVIDESSSFISARAKRFRALKKVMKHIKSIVLLSGTPSPNGMMDLWSQMYLIDQGERLGRTITNYRQRFFVPDGYMGYNYKLKPGAKEQIMELIKDVCVTMTAEDYLELPECINVNEFIELPDKAKQQYKELEKQFIISLDDIDIESPSKAVLGNKLLQICNGSVYDAQRNAHEIHNEKIERLKEIIEDNPGENFLVTYNYKHDLEKLQKAFPKAVKLETAKQEDDWNKGKIKILLAHPASAGHGLNLQYGGNVIIWYGLTWNLEYYQQFNKRLHRQGQKNIVRNIHLIAKGCLYEKVLFFALSNKAKTQKDLIDYLKHDLYQN